MIMYTLLFYGVHKIARQIISLRSLALSAKLAVFPLTCFEYSLLIFSIDK